MIGLSIGCRCSSSIGCKMRKRMRLTQNMGDHHGLKSDDFLSRLPDEILVSILFGLPLKDVVATSVLSRRWRYLWCQTLRLDFADDKRSDYIVALHKLSPQERNKYINRVNEVIRQHRSETIEEFKISFDLNKDSKGAISNWIEFALSKNVQKLELDLMDKYNMERDFPLNFVFPNMILDKISESSLKQESSSSLPRVPSTKGMEIKFLKVLILKSVNINDEAMSKILVSCKALERLTLQLCGELMNIKSSGLHSLIYLDISCCPVLESIEICDSPNLTYFYYLGQRVGLKVDKFPTRKWYSIMFMPPSRS